MKCQHVRSHYNFPMIKVGKSTAIDTLFNVSPKERSITYLQAGNKIGSLKQSQCADLVDNLCNLGVCRCRGGSLGRFPSSAAGCAAGCV